MSKQEAPAVRATTASVRATLEDLASRMRHCAATIRHLCAFYLLDPEEFLGTLKETPAGREPSPKRINGAKKPARPKAGKRQARPTPAPTGMEDSILAALKAAGEPVSPSQLAKALKLPGANLSYRVRPLIESGRVVATGVTTNRRLSLP